MGLTKRWYGVQACGVLGVDGRVGIPDGFFSPEVYWCGGGRAVVVGYRG